MIDSFSENNHREIRSLPLFTQNNQTWQLFSQMVFKAGPAAFLSVGPNSFPSRVLFPEFKTKRGKVWFS